MPAITPGIRPFVCSVTTKIKFLLSVTLGVLLFSVSSFSQSNFGRILGIVTDQTGGVISGATVTVIDTQRGVARALTTDIAGEYNAPTLIPGTYLVRVEAKGFKRLERQNVVLEVGKEIRVDLTVQPGEQTQSVTVTEAIPLVETTNATLGGTLNNADINDLPLNGRNYQSLLALRPGVMLQPGGGPWTQSTNGVRPDESAWMVDGVINANFYDARPIAGMPSPISDGATILPIDAIQEFNLEENPKAEFGWKPGAVVNVGVKSGTNNLRGSAYAFGRSDAFNARNIFNPAPTNGVCVPNPGVLSVCDKTSSQLKQFGTTLGGPIRKDKLFFFAGYEGLRSNISNAFGTTAPETGSQLNNPAIGIADPKNSMVDAINAVRAAGLTPSTVSEQLVCPNAVGKTLPLPATFVCSGGLFQGASANSTFFASTFPNLNTSDNGIAKLDYHITDKHQLNGMLFIGNYNGTGEDHPLVNASFRNIMPIRVWSTVANWIWTPNSRWVNDARIGYDRMNFAFVSGDNSVIPNGTGYALNTGVTTTGGLPNINFGSTTGPLFAALGGWRGRPFSNQGDPYYDVQDSLSYLHGKHSIKFGGEYAHVEADWQQQDRGRIDFLGGNTPQIAGKSTILEDFFAGQPKQGFLLVPGNPVRRMTWNNPAGFIQDDWRVTQRVIINLGLRYEYKSPIHEVNGLLGNFDPNSPTGLVQQGQSSVGNTLWKPDYKDFSPRVGFAWDVTGKGATVVRGGGSIMYSSFVATMIISQPGLQDTSPATNLASVPVGACNIPVPTGQTCSQAGGQTFGGTMVLASTKVPGSTLNWNGNSPSAPLFTASAFPSCTTPATTNKPCTTMAVDPNLRQPYVANWSLGITHAFTSNLSLEVSYVGNHGARLTGFRDINQAPLGAGYCLNALTAAQAADACKPTSVNFGDVGTAEQEARPYFTKFPYLNFINQLSNVSHSNYNGLQTTLTERASHGLSFIAGYTYAHTLDNGSLNRFGLLPQNSSDLASEYASSDFDVRHRFTFTTGYDIPGKKGYGQMLEGWKLNAIVTVQSAQPWTISDATNDSSGTGDTADRWDFFGNPNDFTSGSSSIPVCTGFPADFLTSGGTDLKGVSCVTQSGIQGTFTKLSPSTASACKVAPDISTLQTASPGGCYVRGNSVMVPAALGTFGTMGRNIFRDNGYKDVDFSVFKNFTLTERFNAQFRVEVFNLFNRPTIANPYGASNGYKTGFDPSGALFGCGCTTPDIAAGSPIVSSGDNRVMQLGLKLIF